MKQLFVLLFVVLLGVQSFAQEEMTSDNASSSEKTSLKLRIRDNVLRPLGKDWYITVGAGYGMPFLATNKRSPLKEIGQGDWYQQNGDLSVKPIFGTNGGGFALNMGWGHMFNKYIGIDVLNTLAWHPEKLNARINTKSNVGINLLGLLELDLTPILGTAEYYATQKTGTFGIYISPHLIMRWDNGKRFGITGKAGLVMPIFGKTTSRAFIDDKAGRIIETLAGYPILPLPILHQTLQATATTSYKPTIGVSTSIGFDIKVSPKVTFFTEARVQAYTIKLKETVFDEFSLKTDLRIGGIDLPSSISEPIFQVLELLTNGLSLNINSVDEAPVFLTHHKYVDEITEESNTARYGAKQLIPLDPNIPTVDLDKPMEEPGQRFNASTLYFNAGFRFDFDLRSQKLEAKRSNTTVSSTKKAPKEKTSKAAKTKEEKVKKEKTPKEKKSKKTEPEPFY
ncbi:MAG: hypothetical protein H6553_08485 [Chitinophagales bacterium]|nr:hypothetical protein [Chitinophagales bacterium]